MDDHGGEIPCSSEFLDWERALVQKVVARFPELDRNELRAELEATAWEEKCRERPGIRDRKAYLHTALMNRAKTLIRKQRRTQSREMSLDFYPGLADHLAHSEEAGLKSLESRQELSEIRRKLDTESSALLELWVESGGNKSLMARLTGKSRNTIHRRLREIFAEIGCPIENVSGRFRVTARQRRALGQIVHDPFARIRDVFKARLILALAAGQSYKEIARRFKTTAPTIARWKQRFEKKGMEGLKAQHWGRKPRTDIRIFVSKWLQGKRAKQGLSFRRIAQELGLSNSTVYRILKTVGARE